MLYFVRCRAFSFKVEDLFGVGSIIGQARIKRTKPMTTIPIRLPMWSMRGVFSFMVLYYKFDVYHPCNHGNNQDRVAGVYPNSKNRVFFSLLWYVLFFSHAMELYYKRQRFFWILGSACDFYQVVSKLSFYRAVDLSDLFIENNLVKLGHHLTWVKLA